MNQTNNMDATTEKQTAFYFSSYIRGLKEDLRQTQRWLRQAQTHSGNINTDAVDRYKSRIYDIESKIRNACTSDEEFLQYQESQVAATMRVKDDYSKRLETSLKEKEEKKQKLQEYYDAQTAENRKERHIAWQAKKEYERLLSIEASMPPYMRENLQKFPNNKGYIFKGVWYFGKQPVQLKRGEDPDMYILFQKKFPGNTMLIHEIKYGCFHRVYEKKSKDSARILIEDRILNARF